MNEERALDVFLFIITFPLTLFFIYELWLSIRRHIENERLNRKMFLEILERHKSKGLLKPEYVELLNEIKKKWKTLN